MPIPDGVEVLDFLWTGTALPTGAFSRFGVFTAGFAGDAAAMVAATRTNWDEALAPWTSAFVDLQIRYSISSGGGFVPQATSATISGDITGDCSPPNVTYLAQKLTGVGGRANRGRWFHPGVPEAATTTGGALVGSYVAGVPAAFSSFLDKQTADDLPLYLLHPSTGWNAVILTELVGQTKVATQRRRLRR